MINLFFFFSHFSFLEFPIPNNIAFIGEIGLGGELRAVSTFSTVTTKKHVKINCGFLFLFSVDCKLLFKPL